MFRSSSKIWRSTVWWRIPLHSLPPMPLLASQVSKWHVQPKHSTAKLHSITTTYTPSYWRLYRCVKSHTVNIHGLNYESRPANITSLDFKIHRPHRPDKTMERRMLSLLNLYILQAHINDLSHIQNLECFMLNEKLSLSAVTIWYSFVLATLTIRKRHHSCDLNSE